MGQFRFSDLPMEYWVKLKLSDSARQSMEAAALNSGRSFIVVRSKKRLVGPQTVETASMENESGRS
jgi:hypothetical protein